MPAHFVRNLAAFYGATFLCIGVHMPFFPVWLRANGLDASWIGLIVAIPLVARLTAVPLVTRLTERVGALRSMLIATCALTALGFAALGFAVTPVAILAVYIFTASVWTPVLPLSDAYALRGVQRYRVAYGPVRLWGSFAFVASVLGAGAMIPLVGDINVIWILAGTAGIAVVVSLSLEPDETLSADETRPPIGEVLRIPGVITVILATAVIQGSHAVYYAFGTIDWRAHGIGDAAIASLWAIGVIAEIVLFALSPRLPFTSGQLMMIGAGAAVIRWVMTAFEPSLTVLVAVQLLHGLTYGATQLGTVSGLARLVPGGRMASVQGLLVASNGALMAVATVAAGPLYGAYGSAAYFSMAFLGAIGAIFAFRAHKVIARHEPAVTVIRSR